MAAPTDQDTTDRLRREREGAKTSFEKAIAVYQALGHKDGMAAGYALLGNLYSTTTDYEEAQAAIAKALAINKALQRKKAMAANYRALADTHRYDLDQAEVLLKEAIALHEALGLKEELATDYEKLGAINKSRGEPYEAERLYKQALALTPRLDQGQLLRALEQLYRDRDDPGQAAEMQEQAQAIGKERRKEGSGGRLLFELGHGFVAEQRLSPNSKPRRWRRLCRWRKSSATGSVWRPATSSSACTTTSAPSTTKSRRAELLGRAEAMLREAIALNRTLGREEATAYAYSELAEIVDKRGNLAEVEETLKEAQALYKKLGKEKELGSLYASLGYGRSRRGDQAQACDYWRKGAMAYPDEKRLVDALNTNKCGATQ